MRKIYPLGMLIGLLVVAMLIVTALPAPVIASPTPMLCWGTVTLDGAAAPIGTTVEIFIGADTKESGSGTVVTVGRYGTIMVMADNSRYGEALTYKVNGFVVSKLEPGAAVFSLESQVVNLEAVSGSLSTDWTFYVAGFHPKHLPDSYYGQVVLDSLVDSPAEVQGVYWFDDVGGIWKFWAPGAPDCTLSTLGGGHSYDYMVSVTGHCDWTFTVQ